jgi:hypothetical protein
MNEILEDALISALSLLNSEFESVDDVELSEEYLSVIKKIEDALNILKENG